MTQPVESVEQLADRIWWSALEDRDGKAVEIIAAALRAYGERVRAEALEEAAQLFEEDAKRSDAAAGFAFRDGESDRIVESYHREARICRSDAGRIRALAEERKP